MRMREVEIQCFKHRLWRYGGLRSFHNNSFLSARSFPDVALVTLFPGKKVPSGGRGPGRPEGSHDLLTFLPWMLLAHSSRTGSLSRFPPREVQVEFVITASKNGSENVAN
ncbi:unnamed protein product [Boreogadus saida]